jgi:chromosomal replication initiator protein
MTSPLLTQPGPPAPSLAHLWDTVLDEIRSDPAVSPANFSTWLRGTQLLELVESAGERSEYVVGAPHAFARDRLARTFRPAIERALARCLRRAAVSVRFAVAGGAAPPAGASALDPRCTFDRFVAGRGSEFAVAAARAVADNPALAYNPLYLYGDPGTGKTHLLQAVGHQVLQRRPQAAVVYLPLTPALTAAPDVQGAAVVLLDDVQRVDPGAWEPWLRLLAGLQAASTQLVVAGDRPARELTVLDGRLRAWLQTGLVAGIGEPDFATRLALVRQRATALGAALSPAVQEVIARRAPTDVRELEAMVTRVVAGAELSGLTLTTEHVGALLADVLGPVPAPARRRVTADEVLLATAATFGVAVADLKGRRRDREVVLPRQVAMYLMRQETGASLTEVGAALGGRDHSTVIHGCERVARALQSDARLGELVSAARQLVAGAAASGRPQAAAGLD